MGQPPEVRADQLSQRVGSLHVTPELDVLPALAVRHGRVRHALKQMRALLNRAEKYVRMQQPRLARRSTGHLQIQPVQLLPHFRAALLAHLPQIFPGRCHTGKNRRRIRTVEGQNLRK